MIRDGDRLRCTQGSSENTSQNVIGSLPGQDPEGKWIIFSAHYDGQGVIDGEIYPSANDNLSGIMVVTALARYWPPNPGSMIPGFHRFRRGGSRLIGLHPLGGKPSRPAGTDPGGDQPDTVGKLLPCTSIPWKTTP